MKGAEAKEILSKRLRELTEENRDYNYKMSDKKQAESIGIPYPTFRNYLEGKSDCSASNLILISKFYDVSTDYLLGTTDVKTTDLTTKQICDYTGLSEEAITMLHYTAISSDKGKADIIRTMSILTPGLLALCGYLKSYGTQITLNNNLITERLQSTSLKDHMRVQKAEDNNDFLKWRFLKKCETLLLDFINNQSNTNE